MALTMRRASWYSVSSSQCGLRRFSSLAITLWKRIQMTLKNEHRFFTNTFNEFVFSLIDQILSNMKTLSILTKPEDRHVSQVVVDELTPQHHVQSQIIVGSVRIRGDTCGDQTRRGKSVARHTAPWPHQSCKSCQVDEGVPVHLLHNQRYIQSRQTQTITVERHGEAVERRPGLAEGRTIHVVTGTVTGAIVLFLRTTVRRDRTHVLDDRVPEGDLLQPEPSLKRIQAESCM
ncbi:hypothetical protein E2C01_048005 [Portunus trituberculatus]|uniref:Uncharacterized protein n=1 Tax=Portunus trituberculatus TaxID=210409 RepID=A0A5B7GAD4_PORTR|nr:hypothetical protein [Portunus trituberculatus]